MKYIKELLGDNKDAAFGIHTTTVGILTRNSGDIEPARYNMTFAKDGDLLEDHIVVISDDHKYIPANWFSAQLKDIEFKQMSFMRAGSMERLINLRDQCTGGMALHRRTNGELSQTIYFQNEADAVFIRIITDDKSDQSL